MKFMAGGLPFKIPCDILNPLLLKHFSTSAASAQEMREELSHRFFGDRFSKSVTDSAEVPEPGQ